MTPTDLHLVRTRVQDQDDFSGPPTAGVVAYAGAAFTTLGELAFDVDNDRLVVADEVAIGFGTGDGADMRIFSDGTDGIIDMPAASGRVDVTLSSIDTFPPFGIYAPLIHWNKNGPLPGVATQFYSLYLVGDSMSPPTIIFADAATPFVNHRIEHSPSTNTTTVQVNGGSFKVLGMSGAGKITLGDANDQLALFGGTPVEKRAAYTQTFATASRVHAGPTATSVAATATSSLPWGYATEASANAIVTAINNLIADVANVKQLLNSVIDDLQAFNAVG